MAAPQSCETVIAPMIHHNGDKAETLLAALETAYRALTTAQHALQATAPNARNYYPVDGVFPQARAQYQRRMQAIHCLREALLAEYRQIEDQV